MNAPRLKTISSIKLLAVLLVLSALLISCIPSEAKTASGKYVRHFVSVKFKDTTTANEVQEVLDSFQKMKSEIPEVVAMEFGPDVSVENKNKGFTHGFLLTFASEKDRDAYLVHPAHTKFLAYVKPLLDDLFIFDFLTTKPGK